jgi:bifunctional DNA-binding transcriptional regulator/antitoxin component of YhaV-PrlF toxin-antitoxin module
VTSKRQVTLPKAIADRYGIRPGDTLGWLPDGDHLRVTVGGREEPAPLTVQERLRLFDEASRRREERRAEGDRAPAPPRGPGPRGWTRDELHERGRSG